MAEREGFEPSIRVTPYTNFPGWRLRPLGHLSVLPKPTTTANPVGIIRPCGPHPFGAAQAKACLCKTANAVLSNPRYELPRIPTFQAGAFDHSATSPYYLNLQLLQTPFGIIRPCGPHPFGAAQAKACLCAEARQPQIVPRFRTLVCCAAYRLGMETWPRCL